MRKLSATETRLQEIQTTMRTWTDYVGELQVPADIVPAMITGRIELLKLAQPRELSADECDVIYRLIGGLLETNRALQQHSQLIAQMADDVSRGIGGLSVMASRRRRNAGTARRAFSQSKSASCRARFNPELLKRVENAARASKQTVLEWIRSILDAATA